MAWRPNDFVALLQSAASNTPYSVDDGRLADVDRKLALVRQVTPVGLAHLRRIAERAQELIRLGESASSQPANGVAISNPNLKKTGGRLGAAAESTKEPTAT